MSPNKLITDFGSDIGSYGSPPGLSPDVPPPPADEPSEPLAPSSVGKGSVASISRTTSPIEARPTVPSANVPLNVKVCSPNSIPGGTSKVLLNAPAESVSTVPSLNGVELIHTSTSVSGAKPSPCIATVRSR